MHPADCPTCAMTELAVRAPSPHARGRIHADVDPAPPRQDVAAGEARHAQHPPLDLHEAAMSVLSALRGLFATPSDPSGSEIVRHHSMMLEQYRAAGASGWLVAYRCYLLAVAEQIERDAERAMTH